ncbi:MAG: glycosyltransferase [Glaciimonas sp.]|nr:glycosyltransferase [Glaciimonas sp.]
MIQPLLSIIIPSCNRHEYLVPVLRTLLDETCAQIVVSDNSMQSLSVEILENLGADGRMVYQHHTQKLSVVENFERALGLATGRYLIFIGDDDCVGPCIEDIARWALEEHIDAVVSYQDRFIVNYFWPGVTSKYFGDGYAGKLFVAKYSGEARPLNNRLAILKSARRPGHGLGSMARAYHGIVSRELVERVVTRYGSLFGGVSPDIYSATLLTYESQSAYIVDFPFVIPGASAKSTAGEGAARDDTDRLYGRDHIQRFGEALLWDERIPAFYSPITVWAFSQQQALDRLGDSSLSIDFPRLYLRCALHSYAHRLAVIASIRHWLKTASGFRLILGMLTAFGAEVISQFRRVWYRFITPPRAFTDLSTVGDAHIALKHYCEPWRRVEVSSSQINSPSSS